MAKQRKPAAREAEVQASAEDKIARLFALLLVKEIKNNTEKVPLLRRVGFSVAEVSDLLNISTNQVSVADHLGRKNKNKAG